MAENLTNYDKMAERGRELFLGFDQEKMVRRFSLEHDEKNLYILFFGKKMQIDRQTGSITYGEGGEKVDYNAVMAIYDVLCSAKENAMLTGQWKSLENLSPHSNFGAAGNDIHDPITMSFSGKVPQLKAVCERLGAGPATTADVGYVFNVFPFLPVIFQFWDGDDEFDPKVVLLFDEGTLDFIKFETAWYVACYLKDMLVEELNK